MIICFQPGQMHITMIAITKTAIFIFTTSLFIKLNGKGLWVESSQLTLLQSAKCIYCGEKSVNFSWHVGTTPTLAGTVLGS
jgi:hypothetical protein